MEVHIPSEELESKSDGDRDEGGMRSMCDRPVEGVLWSATDVDTWEEINKEWDEFMDAMLRCLSGEEHEGLSPELELRVQKEKGDYLIRDWKLFRHC